MFILLLQLNRMKFTKKSRILVLEFMLYWLIITNAITPILCMDADQTGKGILNANLPMPGADLPIISTTTGLKKSTNANSQVCNSFDMRKHTTSVTMISYFRNIYTNQNKQLPRENINANIVQRILKHLKD